MSQGMIGADLASLRELAKSASLSGQELAATATSLQNAVTHTRWVGHDADSFRSRWASSIRPTLNTASASLDSISSHLFAQADAQEAASSATGGNLTGGGGGGGGGGGTTGGGAGGTTGGDSDNGTPDAGDEGDSNGWSDAFTDPNYEHAPGGLEFALRPLMDDDSAQAAGLTNSLKFAADKFDFDVGLANADDLAAMMPKFASTMEVVGKGLGGLGLGLGALDIASGIANEDPFRVGDGAVSMALAGATMALSASVVGAPVAAAIGVVSLAWGLASLASGDVPVTKRIWDAGAAVVGGVKDAANAIGDGLGWLGGKLGFG